MEEYQNDHFVLDGVIYTKFESQIWIAGVTEGFNMSVFVVPDGVYGICNRAFSGNQRIRKVVISDSVRIVQSRAFEESSLEEIEFGKNVEDIGNSAFHYFDILPPLTRRDSLDFTGSTLPYR